ncbi:hypothetical protein TNCV_3763901 [Trichonephila clavipes]|uniref:Uncharacterized protein n=1 Tax=Trichonephila clavipes TaxID=2585209 RepID=A0A8X6VVE9_TRICX|nr:hypothetical protein TNCV_3763901 [Trichonephila clavipes]
MGKEEQKEYNTKEEYTHLLQMMIPAYNKAPFETGIHYRRKTDFFPEEDATMSYSRFEPEPKPTRLQTKGHSSPTGWTTTLN